MLDKLEFIEIQSEQAKAVIRPPQVEPRRGPAVRCIGLSIGYEGKAVAKDINIEIEHGSRSAIVGDNGQGKTTLLRTIVRSLEPVAGDVRWGHGCNIGTYAQHVYTSLPEKKTVLEYLEYEAIPGTKAQTILDTAGAMLFRGEAVNKKVSVLSGGERARLCMAAILLGNYNILVLDEPGNHLDVETVDALANALLEFKGTVIFTSHDRHFMNRIATSIIEVKDGTVVNYHGNYESYLYMVNQEIDDAEFARTGRRSATSVPAKSKESDKERGQNKKKHPSDGVSNDERLIRKEIANLEKSILKLDGQRKTLHEQLMKATDPMEAMRLHEELEKVSTELETAEMRWAELQEQVEAD